MYDELVKRLREFASIPAHCENVESCDGCSKEDICLSFTNERISEVATQAADAIEGLSKRVDESIPKDDAEIIIAEVATPRWIPVEERLPEDGADILAVQSYCGEVRIVPANYDRGVWYDCVFNRVAEHITHWMPLPSPPAEE